MTRTDFRRRGLGFTTVKGLAATLVAAALLVGACGRSTSDSAASNSSPAATSSAGAASSAAPSATSASADSAHADSASAGSSAETGSTAADLVPAEVKARGVLRVATAEGYPPMEMFKEGTTEIIGVDPELGELIAQQLGLKFELTNTSFVGLIPGLQASHWDVALSSMSDTEERRKAVDFVDYFVAGGSIMVAKGNPEGIKGIADLCGKSVVGAKGSSNLAILTKYNDASCTEKMKILESEDAPTGLLQLDTQRAIATVVDYPVAVLLAQKAGKYEVLPEQYESGPWGMAVNKNSPLVPALKAALDELIANGKYGELLDKYGVSESAVTSAVVNDGK